ncbi:TerC family protein [Candidatus Deianiraea vastatrix]|uniref:TerC-related integral membrane protein n=1 Tax=Candidatus Deianiraea vastatrix TaxID=2163644 RepID=A0A5B8XFJ9_9RICK|nr:hypothetical protein [Candidatus Deianiraea vastatrix]QED23695.1 Putative TerC-related integral membrane protein [Candidatus Deianiraea vastatrix]
MLYEVLIGFFIVITGIDFLYPKRYYRNLLLYFICLICFSGLLFKASGAEEVIHFGSVYLVEMMLSIDNVFAFIVIVSAFRLDRRGEMIVVNAGVIIAILMRVIFISIGVKIYDIWYIERLMGLFLVITGVKMVLMRGKEGQSWLMARIKDKGRDYGLIIAIICVGIMDVVFAIDSVPVALSLTRNEDAIIFANVFSIMGIRGLFFIMKEAGQRFNFLENGICYVLVFIGCKMLLSIHIGILLSVSIIIGIFLCSMGVERYRLVKS